MILFRNRRRYFYIIGIFFLVFYILPNLLNFRESRYFSESKRIEQAKLFTGKFSDSIRLSPGEYYKSGGLYTFFFGEKNRELWTTPVLFKVFSYDSTRLRPYEIGGSQQTISIRLRDSNGKSWVLRSVNKDQRNVLPWWLRPSIARSIFRDQVSAMNPYGAKVVSSLSASLHLPHTRPEIYWVPYNAKHGKYNERIAGRVVYLEEFLDATWRNAPLFLNAIEILDTDEMEALMEKEPVSVDTLLYLKTRLFDMLINDWDRHKDQWRWALTDSAGQKVFKPIAKDRDMAFYVFDEGIINKLAAGANDKFQSYRKDFGSIKGLMHQSEKMDKKLLKGLPKHYFIAISHEFLATLDAAAIKSAFSQYPPVIYHIYGVQHENILRSRLSQLPVVAEKFHQLVNED